MLSPMDKDIMIYLEKSHAITIKQAARIFYQGKERPYDRARKKLRELEIEKALNSYENKITHEKVYYCERKLSAHDLYVLDFYSKLHEYGCKNIHMETQKSYMKKLIRPDAFFRFEYNGSLYFVLLEVDFTHFTSMSKFQVYEKLYKEKELQAECYGEFPLIVVMGPNSTKYMSKNFEVVYMDYALSNFEEIF